MPALDPFAFYQFPPGSAPIGAFAVTPADADLPTTIRRVRVGVAGDLSITDRRGVTTIIPDVQAGEVVDCLIHRINATGTTAAQIIGFI